MKGLVLAVVLMVMVDRVVDDGAGLRATWALTERLLHGTERDVSGSVYRR